MRKTLFVAAFLVSSVAALAGEPTIARLAGNDRLNQVAGAIATQWADGNISTGTTALRAGALVSAMPANPKELAVLAQSLLNREYRAQLKGVKSQAAKLTPEAVEAAVKAVAAGNAYDPRNQDGLLQIRRATWAVLRALGANPRTLVGHAGTRVKSRNVGQIVSVDLFVFVNPETKKLVSIFTVQGTM